MEEEEGERHEKCTISERIKKANELTFLIGKAEGDGEMRVKGLVKITVN